MSMEMDINCFGLPPPPPPKIRKYTDTQAALMVLLVPWISKRRRLHCHALTLVAKLPMLAKPLIGKYLYERLCAMAPSAMDLDGWVSGTLCWKGWCWWKATHHHYTPVQ